MSAGQWERDPRCPLLKLMQVRQRHPNAQEEDRSFKGLEDVTEKERPGSKVADKCVGKLLEGTLVNTCCCQPRCVADVVKKSIHDLAAKVLSERQRDSCNSTMACPIEGDGRFDGRLPILILPKRSLCCSESHARVFILDERGEAQFLKRADLLYQGCEEGFNLDGRCPGLLRGRDHSVVLHTVTETAHTLQTLPVGSHCRLPPDYRFEELRKVVIALGGFSSKWQHCSQSEFDRLVEC